MKRRLVVLLLRPSFLAAFMCGSAGSQSLTIPLPLSLPFRIDSARVVARDLALARPTDVALGPDGAVYVVDFGNTRVYKLSSDGKMLWQFGHAGDGPGEFRLPTRLAVGSDNSVLVWDAASEQVTRVDSTGGFVGRQFLHVDFATVDNILGLAGGRWLFTGVSHAPEASSRAMHILDDSLRHVSSFGSLPISRNRYALDAWGAGIATLTPSGSILFVRRLPYEVTEFRANGTPISSFSSDIGRGLSADDGVEVTRNGTQTIKTLKSTVLPGRATRLPTGQYWGGHYEGQAAKWDVFSSAGKLLESVPVPEPVSYFVGYDRLRGILWFRGTIDDEPVLLRARVTLR